MRRTGVTSHDVAKLAGVSQPTVSRALSGQPGVSAETRMRIESAVTELGYVPNLVGRTLSTKRANVVGFVINELENPFFIELVGALHNRLKRSGYRLVLYTDPAGEGVDFDELMDGSIAGVVLATTNLDSVAAQALIERHLPCVLINRGNPELAVDASLVDNLHGAGLVADLLVELGHTRIGAVLGHQNASTTVEREAGLRAGLRKSGQRLSEEYVVRGEFNIEAGKHAFRAIFETASPPTALMCVNDTVAIGVLDEARRLGIDVPGALTVIGFDDIAMSSMAAFDLTTVHCDLAQMAVDAAQLLLRRIESPQAQVQRIFQHPTLTLRGTHGPPRA
jgi:LacI family transcriptional regulator